MIPKSGNRFSDKIMLKNVNVRRSARGSGASRFLLRVAPFRADSHVEAAPALHDGQVGRHRCHVTRYRSAAAWLRIFSLIGHRHSRQRTSSPAETTQSDSNSNLFNGAFTKIHPLVAFGSGKVWSLWRPNWLF